VTFALGAVASAGILFLMTWQVSKARCFTLVGSVTCRVDTAEPVIALSFDDGPTEEGVRYALAELGRSRVKATFFLTGREVQERPRLVRDLVAAGHEVANHSYSHEQMVARAPSFYEREIALTHSLIEAAGAEGATLFRPPYGKKLIGLPRAVERQGYRIIMWDVEDPADTKDAQAYATRIVSQARPGSIILMHIMYDSNGVARAALPLVIEGLRTKNFKITTVGQLLQKGGTPAGSDRAY
jgi:peptidoglycan/xylan/chitin deacetylase (PgdA/CDA1 family)